MSRSLLSRPLKAILVALLAFTLIGCNENKIEKLLELGRKIERTQSEKDARQLLRYRTDGAYTYTKSAVVAQAMVTTPAPFQKLYRQGHPEDLATIRMIESDGINSFHYYPEMMPENFQVLYHKYYGKNLPGKPSDIGR